MASRREAFGRAYRIFSSRYPPFDGGGAHRWGSRWCSPGRWVVHAAETYSLAVLENLVHWQTNTLPSSLVCIEIQIPPDLAQERLDPPQLPGWERSDHLVSRRAGDAWYDRGATVILWVPSVVSPHESNVLFNQVHPDFHRIAVGDPMPTLIDPRVWPRQS